MKKSLLSLHQKFYQLVDSSTQISANDAPFLLYSMYGFLLLPLYFLMPHPLTYGLAVGFSVGIFFVFCVLTINYVLPLLDGYYMNRKNHRS